MTEEGNMIEQNHIDSRDIATLVFKLFFVIIPAAVASAQIPGLLQIEMSNRISLVWTLGVTVVILGIYLYNYPEHFRKFLSGKFEYRARFTSMILFFSLFVVLNSTLLETAYTGMDMYGLFLKVHSKTDVMMYCTIINAVLSTIATIVFLLIYKFYNKKYGSVDRTPILSGTFTLVFVPLLIVYFPVALFAKIGYDVFYLEVFFPFALAFLGILGYTHPKNKLELFPAELLLKVCVGCMFAGFILSAAGILFVLGNPVILDGWKNHVSDPKEIDWMSLGYSEDRYDELSKAGFLWMVLTNILYLELVVGIITTIIIYRYQFKAAAKREIE